MSQTTRSREATKPRSLFMYAVGFVALVAGVVLTYAVLSAAGAAELELLEPEGVFVVCADCPQPARPMAARRTRIRVIIDWAIEFSRVFKS